MGTPLNDQAEWRFENGVAAVIAHHTSGLSVSLPRRLGLNAKVIAVPDGLSKTERTRLLTRARIVFEQIHGRPVWDRYRRKPL